MSYQIAIRNDLIEQLIALKGTGSYSDAIEALMIKAGVMSESPTRASGHHTANQPLEGGSA